jgi:hypothetical protein
LWSATSSSWSIGRDCARRLSTAAQMSSHRSRVYAQRTTERVLGAVTAGSVRAFEGGAAQHSTVSALTVRMRRETLTAAGAAGERGAVGGNSGSEDAGPACGRCGHGRRAHEHYRSGSDCALCDCPRFSRPLLRRLLGR